MSTSTSVVSLAGIDMARTTTILKNAGWDDVRIGDTVEVADKEADEFIASYESRGDGEDGQTPYSVRLFDSASGVEIASTTLTRDEVIDLKLPRGFVPSHYEFDSLLGFSFEAETKSAIGYATLHATDEDMAQMRKAMTLAVRHARLSGDVQTMFVAALSAALKAQGSFIEHTFGQSRGERTVTPMIIAPDGCVTRHLVGTYHYSGLSLTDEHMLKHSIIHVLEGTGIVRALMEHQGPIGVGSMRAFNVKAVNPTVRNVFVRGLVFDLYLTDKRG